MQLVFLPPDSLYFGLTMFVACSYVFSWAALDGSLLSANNSRQDFVGSLSCCRCWFQYSDQLHVPHLPSGRGTWVRGDILLSVPARR